VQRRAAAADFSGAENCRRIFMCCGTAKPHFQHAAVSSSRMHEMRRHVAASEAFMRQRGSAAVFLLVHVCAALRFSAADNCHRIFMCKTQSVERAAHVQVISMHTCMNALAIKSAG